MIRLPRIAFSVVAAFGLMTFALMTLGAGPAAGGSTARIELVVTVTADGGRDVPVFAGIDIPGALRGGAAESISVTVRSRSGGAGRKLPGQLVERGGQVELWWILPRAEVGTTRFTATLSSARYRGRDVFAFRDTPGSHLDLAFAGRTVTRYMCAFDTSSKKRVFETYKPYHHVLDAAGTDVITKGAPGHDPHHRGIYIGWNKLTVGPKRYDFWSMRGNSAQVHVKFLALSSGPVLGRSVALVHWRDGGGRTIVSEERETICFRQPASARRVGTSGGPDGAAIMLMEFRSRIKAVAGDMVLDGNPEHGGFQYRPHNDVAVNAGAAGGKQTADAAPEELKTVYEFHKDGIKTGGQRLNHNRDLPWAAISYALRGRRYTVQHMNHTTNPKGTVYSAYRQYGRFGAYFKKELKAGEVLPLRYRLHVTEGPVPPRQEMIRRHAAFNRPPEVKTLR